MKSILRTIATCSTAWWILAGALAIQVSAAAPDIAIPSISLAAKPEESVLLLDEHTVARTTKLTQHFFRARKHPSNPVMRKTEAWEGVGPYVWGNRLMQDEQT